MTDTEEKKERALAVAVVKKGADREQTKEYLDELSFLAETAGAEVIDQIYQELAWPNKSTVVGKGKVEELKQTILDDNLDMIIFDEDLSPAQMRNLEKALEIKIMDRSGIILDIFARRAQTLEAKTQVELAQLQYLMPRLTRMWTHLSKQYGGIGTKGPGETQIETDRRLIRTRVQLLKEKLENINTQNAQQRKNRSGMPRFALVGYTNAGKSTLMNVITGSEVYIEDKLFATLSTTVRNFELPGGKKSILSDTVGFIRKLPTHLVASFRSTLAEASEADVLIHMVDVSNPYYEDHIRVVEETLESMNITDLPTILVFNKIDMMDDKDSLRAIEEANKDSLFISAGRGINIQALLDLMQQKYDENSAKCVLLLPYVEMELVAKLYKLSEVLEREDKDVGIMLTVKIAAENLELFNNTFSNYFWD